MLVKLDAWDLGANDRLETAGPAHIRPRPESGLESTLVSRS